MRNEVTENDIREGRRGLCCSCPVAIAVCRNHPGSMIEVYAKRGMHYLKVDGLHILAPEAASRFIDDFDHSDPTVRHHGSVPDPFAFELPSMTDPRWEAK